ncbi:branched-chain amino acid ABC transporter permease [Thiothrix eikelboomii]|uniref:Amino acid/amide ABC transporter membrane protein 1, HAAT family (TC 3.A.1.4.-) n=1 Tax=Thiothrix eikelboomii TaxID=92487 RepID=A0A1T4WEL5_9GAMM|nr:branched-chain amino acid ABC transporter permease [Thiothrix eikelboomii]SKA75589.1 amino acid/amide ABC transporter membrane protein 1, HAAT family (TC 3.A.1.4.-) [Thiothrix eikelboomii]
MTDFLNALVVFANFVFIPALTYGCQLALGSLGVTMIYSVLRFSNFAQGETMAFGTVITIMMTWWLQSLGVSLGPLPTALLALPVGILVTSWLLLATDRYVYRYYRTQRSKSITFVMASLGVMFIMNGLVRLLLGPNDQNFADGERFFLTADAFRAWSGLDEALVIRTSQALTILLALILVGLLFWFLQRTKTGKAMRAYADNENLALLSGINPDRIVRITWIITAALATVAGVLYGLDKGYKPLAYYNLLLPIFAAVIVGGIGKPIGAVVGGFIIAFSEVIVTYAYKKVLTYLLPPDLAPDGLVQLLSTEYKFAVSFVILVIVLLVKPTGIFKGKVL